MNTRRILALGAKDCGVLDTIKDLTGEAPSTDPSGSAAGLIHYWDVKTKYYSTRVPVWIDEVDDPIAWRNEFTKPEAADVVQALGAWIYCFRNPLTPDQLADVEATLEAITEVIQEHHLSEREVVMLAVMFPSHSSVRITPSTQEATTRERVEDICMMHGFELVDGGAGGRNEFGEKEGKERIREALEANSWDMLSSQDDAFLEDDFFSSVDEGHDTLNRDEVEMTSELFGLSAALRGAAEQEDEVDSQSGQRKGEASQVDDLDRIMQALSMVREQSAALPEAERKRMAAEAVKRFMRLEP